MGEQKRYVKRILISINQYKDIPQQRNHPSAGLFSFIGSGKAIYSTFAEQIRRQKEKKRRPPYKGGTVVTGLK